jgi:hypothetical protein
LGLAASLLVIALYFAMYAALRKIDKSGATQGRQGEVW